MKKRRVVTVLISCVILLMFLISGEALASDSTSVDSVKYIVKSSGDIVGILRKVNEESYAFKNILSYDEETGVVSFSNKNYYALSTKNKNRFMEVTLRYIKESGLPAQSKNKLYKFIEQQDGTTASAIKFLSTDTSADFVTAAGWLKPFSGVIGTILGVVALLIFLFMGVSIVIDIAYLVIPGVRAISESGEPGKRPFGVSIEAYKSMIEAESSPDYKSPMGIYLRRRVIMMVIVSVCLLYLISGQIYDLMAWIVDSFGSMFSFR